LCRVELVNVTLHAPVGVEAGSNARVTMRGCTLVTTETAIRGSSLARYTLYNVSLQSTGPDGLAVRMSDNARVEMTGGRIMAINAIEVSSNARVTAQDTKIQAKSRAIKASGNGRVDVSGCEVTATVAVDAETNARVEVDGAKLTGSTSLRNNARLEGTPAP